MRDLVGLVKVDHLDGRRRQLDGLGPHGLHDVEGGLLHHGLVPFQLGKVLRVVLPQKLLLRGRVAVVGVKLGRGHDPVRYVGRVPVRVPVAVALPFGNDAGRNPVPEHPGAVELLLVPRKNGHPEVRDVV